MTLRSDLRRRLSLLGWAFALTLGTVGLIVVFSLAVTTTALLWLGLMVPVFLGVTALVRGVAGWHRRWAGRVLGTTVATPYRHVEGRTAQRVRGRLADPATWRDLAWLLVAMTVGLTLCTLVVGLAGGTLFYLSYPLLWAVTPHRVFGEALGFLTIRHLYQSFALWVIAAGGIALWWAFTPVLMRSWARLTRSLLGPTENALLRLRAAELAQSRASTVDTQAAELRRIERDLHDGAQARLAALGMSLGLADEIVERNPAEARELLAEAQKATSLALSELRSLVRGIHPPVLADRGLAGAVQALALDCPLQTEVAIDLPGRLPAPVESACYFAVAESLANVLKHSGADRAWIALHYVPGRLTIDVTDDGRGGADPAAGTGLRGVQRRLAAFDGTMTVSSPPGGPTQLRMELPCESLSPRTSPCSETA